MRRFLLIVIFTLFVGYYLTQNFMPSMGAFTSIISTVIAVVALAAFAYTALIMVANPKLTQEMPSYRLSGRNKPYVDVFRNDPDARDLSTEENPEEIQRIVTSGRTCRVDNNTEILVLDDAHPRLVKVRMIEGDFRGHDGWIWREDLEVRGQNQLRR